MAERYGIGMRAYTCELLSLLVIMIHAKSQIIYRPLPKYPAVTRDISLTVDEKVTAGALEEVIRENGGSMLEDMSACLTFTAENRWEKAKTARRLLSLTAMRKRR